MFEPNINCPACGKQGEREKGNWFTCPDCHGSWRVEGYTEWVLDNRQLQLEIIRHEAISKMPCPNCGDCNICLLPYGDEGIWNCTSCDTDIAEDYIYSKLERLGIPPLKCIRCGEPYSMSKGHICKECLTLSLEGGALPKKLS